MSRPDEPEHSATEGLLSGGEFHGERIALSPGQSEYVRDGWHYAFEAVAAEGESVAVFSFRRRELITRPGTRRESSGH